MKYDKKSFCAGIAVGTQLKGWASVGAAGGGGSGGEGGIVIVGNAAIFDTGPEIVYAPVGPIPVNGNPFILSTVPEIIFELQTEE